MSASGSDRRALLSVVIPVYYNEDNIPVTWEALRQVLEDLPQAIDWEVIFVDDGSGDDSYRRLEEVRASAGDRVSILKLSRNFGQVAAILAGMKAARGDCCVVMSADLQDPPELILEMAARWNGGARKIVLATRADREDGAIARLTSRAFYWMMRRFALPTMPVGGFDFFLVDRRVLDIVNATEERNTFLQGHILWTGFEPELIEYTRRKREIGRSRWTLSRKVKYFFDGFVTYTVAPIRFISLFGLLVSMSSFAYAIVIMVARIFMPVPAEWWAPWAISILILAGVQLVMLGIIGEYLWRNYAESRKLPNYVVESSIGPADRAEPEDE